MRVEFDHPLLLAPENPEDRWDKTREECLDELKYCNDEIERQKIKSRLRKAFEEWLETL